MDGRPAVYGPHGSPYLIAHGMGVPVSDAVTTVDINSGGTYHVYVRTYNWTSPWTTKPGAGAFQLSVGGKRLHTVGQTGNRWQWQKAGTVRLKAGKTQLRLHDLTGLTAVATPYCSLPTAVLFRLTTQAAKTCSAAASTAPALSLAMPENTTWWWWEQALPA